MKKFFKAVVSIVLCVNFIFCSSSCEQNDSSKGSNSSSVRPPYQYKPIPPSPSFDFETFDWSEWEDVFEQIESKQTYVITYYIDLEYNYYVGSEWGFGVTYNGEYIESESKVVLTDSHTEIELVAFATEFDAWNDYGSTTVTFDTLEVRQKQTKWVTVIVRENNGRYTGNIAEWIFDITIERIE